MTVRSELSHVWPGSALAISTPNTAQRVLDGVSYFSEAVVGVVAQPSKIIGSYVADQIAPKYWRPNHEITVILIVFVLNFIYFWFSALWRL